MSKQQHSLRVVHRETEQHHKPGVNSQLPLQMVFEDMKAIADLIEREVNCNSQMQPVQQGQSEQLE